ncbi:hypothetical protein VPHK469_0150 [Vibrio phage K469]
MFNTYIHRSMFAPPVQEIIDIMVANNNSIPHPDSFINIVSNGEPVKTLVFRAAVVVDDGKVLKSMNVETAPMDPSRLECSSINYDEFKDRVMGRFSLEDDARFSNVLSAYCGAAPDIMELNLKFSQSMLIHPETYDDFDDFLLNEDGTSKSTEDLVCLSDELREMVKGKQILIIGGSVFTIQQVGDLYMFTHQPSELVLEL